MFLNNHPRFVKIVLALATMVVLFGVGQLALAQTPISTANTGSTSGNAATVGADVLATSIPVVGVTIKGVLYIVAILIGVLISFVGALAGWALQFNMSILTFSPSFMMVGWTIFRDIANLGFVLGIIIIAIATILRYKNYTAKQILWKLIVAALIVNFSLVIGGAFITVSNSVSSYLLNAMSDNGGAGTIAKIGDFFGYIKIVTDVSSWGLSDLTLGFFGNGSSIGVILALAVIVIFGVVFLFTMLAFAGMLFLRYFWLVFLLIVSPVTWLLWIFPSTNKYFKQWWEKFLHWIQYAPIMLVFTYIALTILQGWSSYQKQMETALGPSGSLFGVVGGSGSTNNLHVGTLMVAVVACAMLIGGLKMAQAMGMGGAAWALGAADKTKKWAQKRAKRTGSAIGTRALNAKRSKDGSKSIKERMQTWGSTRFGKAVGLGAVARGTMLADEKMKKTAYEDVEELKKKYGNLPPKEMQKVMDTFMSGGFVGKFGGTDGQAAMYEMMAEKDALGEGKHDIDVLARVTDLLKRQGKEKLAGDIQKKLGLNDRAMKHLQDAKKGVTGSDALAFAEMKDVIDKMSEDEYKAYMKNMGNVIGQTKGEIFGVPNNYITTKLREYNIEQGVEDSTMVRAMSSSIKNDINPKTGVINPGGNHLEQYAKDAIKAQLKWMDEYMRQYSDDIADYEATPNHDMKKLNNMKGSHVKMLSERDQFNKLLVAGKIPELLDRMKYSSTSSISEMRDFARALKIA